MSAIITLQQERTSEKPITEKQLFALQETYLHSGSQEAWQAMYSTLVSYAKSLTLKINKGRIYIKPTRLQDIANDSVLDLLDKYSVDPDFRVNTSFAGVIKWPIIEALYKKDIQAVDKEMSLNAIVQDSQKTELQDIPKYFGAAYYDDCNIDKDPYNKFVESRLTIYKDIFKIFDEFDDIIKSPRLSLLFRAYLTLIIRKPKNKKCLAAFKQKFIRNSDEEEMLEMIELEFYNRLSQES